ncbi:MAG: peptidase acyl-coenzyme A:6-aminopenicillanic acid acyl-transferase [Deltaproteobacteria bacterium]|nr:peptidase acyl-coenzyme A:6-aminopenicillanic acid acyl-transferase [Deltaproteobacteria bacterium]
MSRIFTVFVFAVISVLCVMAHGEACTLWASAGDVVAGGGVIIAKNRDNSSSLHSKIGLVFPEKGYRFLGILDTEANGYVVAAVNEKGLVVVNASANSVRRSKRHVATEDVTQRVLEKFDSVDSLAREKGFFRKTHPAIYLIADSSKIMSVEVAPGGNTAIKVKDNGSVAFTNHYTAENLSHSNERVSRESLMRLKRINQLIGGLERAHTLDDFISISRDRNSGGPGAVMRDPRQGSVIRTLATFVIRLEHGSAPTVYTQIFNEGTAPETFAAKLDRNFWDPENKQ